MNIKYLLLSSLLVFCASTGPVKRNKVGQTFSTRPSVQRLFFYVTCLVSFWTPQFRACNAWKLLTTVYSCWMLCGRNYILLLLPSPFPFSYSLVGLSLTNQPGILLDWLQILAFINVWKEKEMYLLNSIINIISNNNNIRKLAKMWYGQSYAPTQTE